MSLTIIRSCDKHLNALKDKSEEPQKHFRCKLLFSTSPTWQKDNLEHWIPFKSHIGTYIETDKSKVLIGCTTGNDWQNIYQLLAVLEPRYSFLKIDIILVHLRRDGNVLLSNVASKNVSVLSILTFEKLELCGLNSFLIADKLG